MKSLSITIIRLLNKRGIKELSLSIFLFFLVSLFVNGQAKKRKGIKAIPFTHKSASLQNNKAWNKVNTLVGEIKRPVFADAVFNITDFGAVANDTLNDGDAIAKAIATCFKGGGGKVVIPAGIFISNGPIHLKSNINLQLSKGAEIIFG